MSLPSVVLDAMLAAGCSGEQIVAAVKAANTEQEERRAAKREGNAKRQREFKARRKAKGQGNEGNALPPVTPPIEEIIPPEQPSPSGEACLPKPRATRPHPLPADWKPVLTPAAQRTVAAWQPGRLERAVNSFRDHAADKGRVSKDWQAAFRKWIENEDKWNPVNGRPGLSAQNDRGSVRGSRPNPALDMVLEAERELQAEAFGQDPWPDWAPRAALPSH